MHADYFVHITSAHIALYCVGQEAYRSVLPIRDYKEGFGPTSVRNPTSAVARPVAVSPRLTYCISAAPGQMDSGNMVDEWCQQGIRTHSALHV